jgi:hypothetical protein
MVQLDNVIEEVEGEQRTNGLIDFVAFFADNFARLMYSPSPPSSQFI